MLLYWISSQFLIEYIVKPKFTKNKIWCRIFDLSKNVRKSQNRTPLKSLFFLKIIWIYWRTCKGCISFKNRFDTYMMHVKTIWWKLFLLYLVYSFCFNYATSYAVFVWKLLRKLFSMQDFQSNVCTYCITACSKILRSSCFQWFLV